MSGPTAERAITNLVHALAEAIDAADGERVEALFGDATFTMAGGSPREGGAAFRQVIERGMLTYGGSPRTVHQVTNLSVEVDPDGTTASGRARITVYQQVPPGVVADGTDPADGADGGAGGAAAPGLPLQAVLVGRYDDRFRRADDGSWRFVSRVMHVDLLGDTSHHSRNRL